MTTISLRWPTVVLLAILFVSFGAAGGYLASRSRDRTMTMPANSTSPTVVPTSAPAASMQGRLPDILLTLSPDVATRADIRTETVIAGTSTQAIRMPAVVQANTYTQVAVTPLVGGRVTDVSVAVGDHVQAGQVLAHVQSPSLAEAETAYVAMQADVEAADLEARRLTDLVQKGGASRKQLEQAHAAHARHEAALEAARSQLTLLGLSTDHINSLKSAADIGSLVAITAPRAGMVTDRRATEGLAVDPATALFTVADLSDVWVMGSLYEGDLGQVGVGDRVKVESAALHGSWQGRIGYIDPQLNPQTRTVQVRVEVPNPDGRLRIGAYLDVLVPHAGGTPVALVPVAAIQTVGGRHFVYLPEPGVAGHFREREVGLGSRSEGRVEVTTGVRPGDVVVTEGSFLLRAERQRLGLRPTTEGPPAGSGRGDGLV